MSASQQVRLSVPVWFMTVNGREKPVWSRSSCQQQQGWQGGQMGIWLPHGFSLKWGFCHGIIINALQIAHSRSLSPVSLSVFCSLFFSLQIMFVLSLSCVKSIISFFVISQFEIMSMCITAKYYAPPTGHYYLQQRIVRDAVLMFDL